jgi:hypothetical protein
MVAYYDRVEDTSTSTGASDFTLSGTAPTGRVSFNDAFGNGATGKRFTYTIQMEDESEWETGIGYLSASTTLVRETIVQSSNSNNVVTFSAGNKKVFAPLLGTYAKRFTEVGRAILLGQRNFLP